jgi:uncharacterized protein (TIGR02147 family)
MKRKSPPDIYAYEDYRKFLTDWLAFKNRGGGFSMRTFSQKAGFKAHNMVQLIIAGKRKMTLRSIPMFTQAMGLAEKESDFFENLVLMNQAPSLSQRLRHLERLTSNPRRKTIISLKKDQLRLFRHWLGPVIYELMQVPGVPAEADALAHQLGHDYPRRDVEAAFENLVAAKLIEIGDDGKWRPRTDRLDSGDGIRNEDLSDYHQHALTKAADAMLTIPASERFFQVLTVAIPNSKIAKLKRLCQEFEQNVWQCVDTIEGAPETVVQVGVHVFPVMRSGND